MPVVLEQEYNFFHSHLPDFSKTHLHEFVLIKGEQVVDFFSSYEKALRDGLQRFGNVPFFIEEVREKEEVHYFHHGVDLN